MSNVHIAATPYARMLAKDNRVDITNAKPTGPYGEVRARDVLLLAENSARATPLARRMADAYGMDIANIEGTGYEGKVRKADVLTALNKRPDERVVSDQEGSRRVKMSGMRRVVARRMLQAHTEIPVVTNTVKNDVTDLLDIRSKLNEAGDWKYSINDFVMRATIMALLSHPNLLASIDGDDLIYYDYVNIGMAVAIDEGLLVPVIKNAHNMSLRELSRTARDLAARARENKLLPDECKGNNFTISNPGMYDVESFTPIINQPDAAILGVCSIFDELALRDGAVTVRKIMRTSMTYDHRIIDGATAAIFQKELKRLLEKPIELLI